MPKLKLCLAAIIFMPALLSAFAGSPARSQSIAAAPKKTESGFQNKLEEFLTLTADYAEHVESENKVVLTGNVRIEMKNFILEADNLTINKNENTISTGSDIVITANELRFIGKGLQYNYEEKHGTFKEGQVSFEGINLSGEEIEITPDTIVMHNIKGTTCDLAKPDYYIAARSIEIRPDGKARFTGISFHLLNRRIFGWRAYTMPFGPKKSAAAPAAAVAGKWSFSPPSMGYSRFGGLEIRSGAHRPQKKNRYGLYFDYYFREGMFTEARWNKKTKPGAPQIALRLGKEYKENQGYFPNTAPRAVYNIPTLEIKLPKRNLDGTRLSYGGAVETGRLKEVQNRHASGRLFLKLNAAYPINPGGRTVFSLVSDSRLALYASQRKYEVLGGGVSAETGDRNSNYVFLEYLFFDEGGSTPFRSDLVNTDDKLLFYGSRRISPRTVLYTDVQYDLELYRTDEAVIGATRRYNCVKFNLEWHTRSKRIGLNMELLNPARR